MEPIPGGFPSAKRVPNAVQVRVSTHGMAKIQANPAALLSAVGSSTMPGVLSFPVPASCGGSTPICCPGGVANNNCGPINIDLNAQAGDQPRLQIVPDGGTTINVTLRARLKTGTDIPVKVPLVGDCGIKVDTTTGGGPKDMTITLPLQFVVDGTTNTTRLVVGTIGIANLSEADVDLTGSFGCQLANFGLGFFIDTLTSTLTDTLKGTIQDQVCKQCPSGDVGECGPLASACDANHVCQTTSNGCLQELGIVGRMRGSALFGGFSPGTTGALDLYEVAGGYAQTNAGGLSLGLLGGMLPGGTPRDRCGPPATAPALATVAKFPLFAGNTRTDVTPNQEFDFAIGVHKSQLEQFAYAGYDGGLLCLTVNNSTVPQLTTDTLSLLSRSLGDLVETSAPMAVGLRPQAPPTITLGKNTFTTDAMGTTTLAEPLLDLKFAAMEIDFFVAIDEQYVRAFTVVADVHLPVGLQSAGNGEIVPVLGAIDDAFSNLSVKNSDAVTETPEALAQLFPTLLNLVLPQLSGGLGGFQLPAIGPLNLTVSAITSVDNNNFMAIFANLAAGTMPRRAPVETHVTLANVEEPAVETVRHPAQWTKSGMPAVTLDLGDARGVEWSYRVDGGMWSAWSTNRNPRIAQRMFWVPGQYKIDVRAREIDRPETMDTTPETIEVALGADVLMTKPSVIAFHGAGDGAGCACDASSTSGRNGAGLLGLLVLMIILPLRRWGRRLVRHAAKLGPVVWTAAIALLPGCSCGSDKPCGDEACMEGELPNGGLGRYTSIASDGTRTLVATYDQGLGDLVVADATDPTAVSYVVVDGIPSDATPIYEPTSYRGGVAEAGPNVGTWTSVAVAQGLGYVSYHDRDETALRFAYEVKQGVWNSYVLDPGTGEEVGIHTSIVVDRQGHPAIAYVATGNDDGMDHRVTELRLARANRAAPTSASDWAITTIVSGTGTCAGACGTSAVCIAGAVAGDAETCVTPTSDCASACTAPQACIMGACTDTLEAPTTAAIASGTGLYASLVSLPDGRLAVAYYDRNKRALAISVESAAGTSMFAETILDQTATRDSGMWASAAVDTAGTVHIAYQDALGDQLMYTTFNGTAGTPEVVDDGQRDGDRTHPVGASASLFLANGNPSIAYQDGLTSDVSIATKGTPWTIAPFATGPLLDGISVAATIGVGGTPVLAWDSIDPATTPLNHLVVKRP